MAHKRVLIPSQYATGEKLTSDLLGIGMRFAANPPTKEPNIEDTIVAASLEGIENEDFRVLSLLLDWFGVHFERVNVDRLVKMVRLLEDKRVKAFWAALAQWQGQDWRFKKLQKVYTRPRLDLMGERTSFQIERHGEDDRFTKTTMRVPNKLLRHRLVDILTPHELAKKHRAYSYRIMIGPSYRADMWALMDQNSDLTPTEIARQTYGSFPTAWEVKRDWLLLNQERSLATAS
ncbi:MAG: hypothetical protein HY074_10365 [Deltaproteobacteria bacterium]|nr:hypothetical protein [Deltaproteobacteria bacterium]